MSTRRDICCNPFKIPLHKLNSFKCLRWIKTDTIKNKIEYDSTREKLKICDSCRKKLYKVNKFNYASDTDDMPNIALSDQTDSDSDSATESVKLAKLNEALGFLKESPISKRKLKRKQYNKKKRKIINVINNNVFKNSDEKEEAENSSILKKLQEKFASSIDRQIKLKIITVVAHWTFSEIQNQFEGASKHMITVAKKLVEEKGVFADPNTKPGRATTDEDVKKVIDFYNSPEVSRIMPGIKDCVTIRNCSVNEKVQKRLVLCNLKEAHVLFKKQHPEAKVQFSKFAELRPKHCILAGGSGTHSVCVCCIHQNVILMIDGARIPRLSKGTLNITNYRDCLSRIICNPPTTNCYLKECDNCPGSEHFLEELKDIFDQNMVDSISYKQWITVDRSCLETLQSNTDDFFENFLENWIVC